MATSLANSLPTIVEDSSEVPLPIANYKQYLRMDYRKKKSHPKRHKTAKKKNGNRKENIKPHSSVIGEDISSIHAELMEAMSSVKSSEIGTVFEEIADMLGQLPVLSSAQKVWEFFMTHIARRFPSFAELCEKLRSFDGSFLKDSFSNLTVGNLKEIISNTLLNWQAVKANPAFHAVVALLTTAILAYYKTSKVTFSAGMLTLFTFQATHGVDSLASFAECILHIVKMVCNGVSHYRSTGSLTGFIVPDEPVSKLIEDVTEMRRLHGLFKPGNFGIIESDIDVNSYEKKLRDTISQAKRLLPIYSGSIKATVTQQLNACSEFLTDVLMEKYKGELREAPFAYSLFGSSGVGKSTINELLYRTLLMTNGYDHSNDFIAYLNPEDPYLSNYKTYTNAAVIDDAANTRIEFSENPFSKFGIVFVNNTPYVLNKADIDEKGKVVALLKVLAVTTNVPMLDAMKTSNQPSSVLRRFIHIKTEVKKEFRKDGGLSLDSAKVVKAFGDSLAPDVWDLTVYEVLVQDSGLETPHPKSEQKDDPWDFIIATDSTGKKLEKASVLEVVKYFKEKSAEHFKIQARIVENSRRWNSVALCKECGNPCLAPLCSCPQIEEQSGEDDVKQHCIQLLTNRKEMFQSWMEGRKDDLSKFAMHLLEFIFRGLDYFLEKNWITLREGLLPTDMDKGVLGPYISRVFRKDEVAMVNKALKTQKIVKRFLQFAPLTVSLCALGTMQGSLNPVTFQRSNLFARSCYYVIPSMVGSMLTGWIPAGKVSLYSNVILHRMRERYKGSILSRALRTSSAEECVSEFYCNAKRNVNTNRNGRVALLLFSTYYRKEICSTVREIFETLFVTEPHTALEPKNISEFEKKDKKKAFDDEWFQVSRKIITPLPVSVFRTPEEVREGIKNNIWRIKVVSTSEVTNCVVVRSGFLLVPFHFSSGIEEGEELEITRHNTGNIGNQKASFFYSRSHCHRIPDTDVAVIWTTKTQHVKDLTSFFPLEHVERAIEPRARIYTRNRDGEIEEDVVHSPEFVKNAHSGTGFFFPGMKYHWYRCAPGTCMSPVIQLDKKSCIGALHVGGDVRSGAAYGCTITQAQLEEAYSVLNSKASILPMSDAGDFETEIYDVPIIVDEVKSKSIALRYPEQDFVMFGSSTNCNRHLKSKVRNLPMKEDIRNDFKVKEDWGSPLFNGPPGGNKHEVWDSSFKKWTKHKKGFPGGKLDKAVQDYTNKLIRKACENLSYWKDEIRPLTWDETVNGIPNKRFVNAINFSSSIGFPLRGPKKAFSTDHGEKDGWQNYRELEPQFLNRAKEMEQKFREGKRVYSWYTTTPKDEPTPQMKKEKREKVRTFQATETASQLLTRRYTLPLTRFLQMNPLNSECAVGIDPCSSEWDELARHLRKFEAKKRKFFARKGRYFAIDYKAYDTSISSQLTMAVGKIFCKLAEFFGYTDEDLKILRGIFNELSFPILDFNGDVVMLDGTNPSGNPLTVFINNIVNSLLLRMFWFEVYPDVPFDENVVLICYGDDMIASVEFGFDLFNMVAYRDWAAKFGLTVTAAIKDAELTHYLEFHQIDFLKRRFVFDDDLNLYVGPIDENSIFKSLCQYMKSETSVEEIASSNIDGALDEWFFHGKKVFENRQQILIKIAEKYRLNSLCNRLYLSYDERKTIFLEKVSLAQE
jgi:hypothetical protein